MFQNEQPRRFAARAYGVVGGALVEPVAPATPGDVVPDVPCAPLLAGLFDDLPLIRFFRRCLRAGELELAEEEEVEDETALVALTLVDPDTGSFAPDPVLPESKINGSVFPRPVLPGGMFPGPVLPGPSGPGLAPPGSGSSVPLLPGPPVPGVVDPGTGAGSTGGAPPGGRLGGGGFVGAGLDRGAAGGEVAGGEPPGVPLPGVGAPGKDVWARTKSPNLSRAARVSAVGCRSTDVEEGMAGGLVMLTIIKIVNIEASCMSERRSGNLGFATLQSETVS